MCFRKFSQSSPRMYSKYFQNFSQNAQISIRMLPQFTQNMDLPCMVQWKNELRDAKVYFEKNAVEVFLLSFQLGKIVSLNPG